jgi:hypothetical protein
MPRSGKRPGKTSGFQVIDCGSLKGGTWQPERISNQCNALGAVPAPFLYLWVFERPDSLSGQLISHGWVQLGPLHVLVSSEARVEDELVTSKTEIAGRVGRFSYDAGTWKSPRFADFERCASYRGYPINTLWCSDAVWKDAFLQVAERSRYFVVDVTAEETPVGLAFELETLFASVESSRLILLMDRCRTDRDETVSFLSEIWGKTGERRAARSGPPALITYSSAAAWYLAKAAWSQWTGRPSIPIANRAATYANWW